MKKVVVISGNTQRPSKTRALAEAVSAQIMALCQVQLATYDLVDAGPGLGAFTREDLPRSATRILEEIETANALVVGSPVYKGSYAGLLKHLFDFLDPFCVAGKPVLLLATGGGERHALMGEHQLRPLFGFFSALTVPTYVYASDADFKGGVLRNEAILARVSQAAKEMCSLLGRYRNGEMPVLAPQARQISSAGRESTSR